MRPNEYVEDIVALLEKRHFLSMNEMEELIPRSDFSSLFRNVRRLVGQGVLRKVIIRPKHIVYELADHKHDHFVCDTCGCVEIITVTLPQSLDRSRVNDVVVRGICEQCQQS